MNQSKKNSLFLVTLCFTFFSINLSTLGESVEKIREPQQHIFKLDQDGRIKCVPIPTDEFEAQFGAQTRKAQQAGPRSEVRFATVYSEFDVTYFGFSDEAEAAFQKAVEIWAQNIASPIPIRIEANWMPLGEGVLGQAGANFIWSIDGVWYSDALADKLSGFDKGGGDPDINATFNSDFSGWYFGLDQNPPFEKYDFVSVVLHEITHGLGFTSSLKVENGVGSWGISSGGSPRPKAYDRFLSDSDTREFLTEKYPNDSTQLGNVITGNDVFMDGPESVRANHGRPVRIYAPPDYSQGSSISHLDEFLFPSGDSDSLMTPTIFNEEVQHDPGPIVRAIFREMGWDAIEAIQFAQFAAGGGWGSDIVMQSISLSPLNGNIQIYSTDGTPVGPSTVFPGLPANGSFTLNSKGSKTFSSSSSGGSVFGTVTVTTDQLATGVVRFTFPGTGVAGVSASPVSRVVTVPVRKAGELNSGVAIRNIQSEAITVELSLLNENGILVSPSGLVTAQIEASAQLSKFISGAGGFFEAYFTANPGDFRGSMVIKVLNGKIAAVGVEFESGSKITTLPVTPIDLMEQ